MLKAFAKDLKKLRELKGVSLAEIAAETRINTKFLNMMESGKFDFQPDTYIRSFLKEYARAIDEDEKRLLNEYDKAKAGFYSPRKFETSEPVKTEIDIKAASEILQEPIYQKSLSEDKPDYLKPKISVSEPEFTNKSTTQKILLVILLLAIVTGIYFLVDYLNNSSDKKSDVKPKTFNEMSSEYENRLSGSKDSASIKDSLKNLAANDSIKLVIKAFKDISVIIVTDDDDKRISGDIAAKDSIIVMAAKKFKFSTSNGLYTDLYLNGQYLKKPFSPKGTSIKNMVITKEGIQNQ